MIGCQQVSLDFTNKTSVSETLLQKPLNSTMVVELSLQGQFKMSKCLLGQIEIKSYLCLSDNYYTESMPIQQYRYAPYCVPSQSNLGEDILLWTLNLTNELVYNSGGHVRIFLPGKMFETMFHTLENDCCLTSSCYLKYRWNFTYWASSQVPKRNKKPKKLTWFTARHNIVRTWDKIVLRSLLPGGVYMVPGEVPGPSSTWSLPGLGVYLVPGGCTYLGGVPGHGGCNWCQGGVSGPGGVPGHREVEILWGV